MARLLLVRHGETAWNAERLIQGQTDDPLAERGHEQARRLKARLVSEPIHALYSSDLSRAYETAAILAEGRSFPVVATPDLREMNFGDWEGRTQMEVRRDFPELAAQRRSDTMNFAPPGGEPFSDFVRRAQSALETILQCHSEETVLIVSHGGPLCVILYTLLETVPIYPWRFRLGNASLTIAEVLTPQDGRPTSRVRAVVTLLNDTCHWSQ